MASEKILQAKKEAVAELVEKLKAAKSGVLVDYVGINVADDTKLRRELREAGVEYTVIKNSILRFAAKEAGYGELDAYLSGSTALALSNDDPVAPAKILGKFAEGSNGKFSLKAGFVERNGGKRDGLHQDYLQRKRFKQNAVRVRHENESGNAFLQRDEQRRLQLRRLLHFGRQYRFRVERRTRRV